MEVVETITAKETKVTQLEIVEENSKIWKKYLEAKDAKGMRNFYSKNPIFLPTFSSELITTPEGVEKYFTHFFEINPKVTFQKTSAFYFTSENSYMQSGMYDFEVDGPNGTRVVKHARLTFDFIKEKGMWKILGHHSSALPEKNH